MGESGIGRVSQTVGPLPNCFCCCCLLFISLVGLYEKAEDSEIEELTDPALSPRRAGLGWPREGAF